MRSLLTGVVLVTACGTDGFGPPAGAPGGSTGDQDSTAAAPSTGGTAADESGGTASGGGEENCPEPNGASFVDGLVHLGRAEGDTFIEILDLITRDGLVYSCTATQGITIWDATGDGEPTAIIQNVGPFGLSHNQFPRCQHIALDAGSMRAVITNRGDEIQPTPWLALYDLADPSSPGPPVSLWSGEASIEGVVLDGNRIYAAAHTDGILVFEDQGGEDLVQIGSFADADSDAWQPALVGDTLLVAEGLTGLRAYDVSADDPQLLTTVALTGSSKDLIVDGETAWVAAAEAVVGLDIADPTAPEVVAERDVQGTALAVAMGTDGILFTAEWDEVRGYDTRSDGLPIVWSESVPTGDAFSRVLTLETDGGGRLYAGEWTGMHAFEQRADPSAPDIVVTPSSVQFGAVEPDDDHSVAFVVRNTGTETLQVYASDIEAEDVSLNTRCYEVEAGGAVAVEATFAPRLGDAQTGTLVLHTNDPDEPQYRIATAGNMPGLDVGDPGPEFALTDLEGRTWTNADLEGKVAVLAYFATF